MQLEIRNPAGELLYVVALNPLPAPPLNFANLPETDPQIPGAPYLNGTVLMVSQGPPPSTP